MIITSKSNELIKHTKNLKEKKFREEAQEFCIEGEKLILEAIDENAKIKRIFIDNGAKDEGKFSQEFLQKINAFEIVYVTPEIMQILSDVKTPQGVIAVVDKSQNDSNVDFSQELFLILDNVQDPGNIGTILRTVDSLNLKQIIVQKGTCDIYNPKVVRSTMGAIFRVKVIEFDNICDIINKLKENNIKILATSLESSQSIYNTEFNRSAIIIGNEANGVSKNVLELSDQNIKIPMLGKTESLNAAVATGIVLYEAIRQIRFNN